MFYMQLAFYRGGIKEEEIQLTEESFKFYSSWYPLNLCAMRSSLDVHIFAAHTRLFTL